MNDLSFLGEKIRQIRKQIGINQAKFALLIGLDTATGVSNYEKGKRTPDINTLVKIAKLGKVNLDWLLTGEGPREKIDNPCDNNEPSMGGIAAPQAEYKPVDPEVARLYNQVQRILKHGDIETVGKLKGFLAALDPGEK